MEFGNFSYLIGAKNEVLGTSLHNANFGQFRQQNGLDRIVQGNNLNNSKNPESNLVALIDSNEKKALVENAYQELKKTGMPISLLAKDGVTLALITNNFKLNSQTTRYFDELVSLSDINCVTKSFATAERANAEHLDTIDELIRQKNIIIRSLADQFRFFEENASDLEFYHEIPNDPSKLILKLPNKKIISLDHLFSKSYININDFYYSTAELAQLLDATLNDSHDSNKSNSNIKLTCNQVWLKPEAELDLDPRSMDLVLTSMFLFSHLVSPPLSMVASGTQFARGIYKFIQNKTIKELLRVGDDPKAIKEIFLSFKKHFLPFEESDLHTFVKSIIDIAGNAGNETTNLLVSMNRTYGKVAQGVFKSLGWSSLD
jgi:hypothetical protein